MLSLTICMTLNFLMSQFIFLKDHRHIVAGVLVILYFAIGLLFCAEEGLRILAIWEYYTMGLGPLCLVLGELIIICFIFDFRQLEAFFMKVPGINHFRFA